MFIFRINFFYIFRLKYKTSKTKTETIEHTSSSTRYFAYTFILKLTSAILISSSLIMFLVLSDIAILKTQHKHSWKYTRDTLSARFFGEANMDGLSPIFKQTTTTSCGAAALAYALTRMGDFIFENDILSTVRPALAEGYSLKELRDASHTFGYKSSALWTSLSELEKQNTLPAIAHFKRGHYVVIVELNEGLVHYFDPALGEIKFLPYEAFSERWSGAILRLDYDYRWIENSLHADQN